MIIAQLACSGVSRISCSPRQHAGLKIARGGKQGYTKLVTTTIVDRDDKQAHK
jgi:hypothetical protein